MTALNFDLLTSTPARIEYLPQYIAEKDSNGGMHVYVYDHSSLSNGYVRKNATCAPIPYKGNFGTGYTINIHNPHSTRYARKVYYIEAPHSVICSANDNCTLCPLYVIDNEEHCLY